MKKLLANPTYLAAKAFGFGYLAFALYLSFTHLIALFANLGSENAWVAPILTDTLMVFGKMLRSHKLAEGTRRVGLTLQLVGATLSLTGNVLAGTNAGDRIIGAMVITLMLVIEFVTDHTKPVEQDATTIAADAAAAQRAKASAAAKKAAATRAANKAAAATRAANKKERDKLNRLAKQLENNPAGTVPASPVSAIPATDAHDTFPVGAYV